MFGLAKSESTGPLFVYNDDMNSCEHLKEEVLQKKDVHDYIMDECKKTLLNEVEILEQLTIHVKQKKDYTSLIGKQLI